MRKLTPVTLAAVAGCALYACGLPACGSVSPRSGAGAPGGGSASPAASASVPGSAPATGPTPRPSGGGGALTVTDNGATVRLSTGQSLTVTLAPHSAFSWHVPAATGRAVRRMSASGGYPGDRPARATFLAVRAGRTVLAAVNDTACLHAQPACLLPQQTWQVVVIVAGSPDMP
jgi:hypothetical protein